MTASLRPLHHNRGGARFQGRLDLRYKLHLADQERAGVANLRRERARVAEGEEHAIRSMPQRRRQFLRRALQGPGDESHSDPLRVRFLKLRFEIGLAAQRSGVASSQNSQPPGARYRRRQSAPGHQRHRRAHNGVLQTEAFRETRSDRRSRRR